ncbi:MAG: thymidine phosphorylase family protein [Nevskiales bacterium]|nr:thymidine phosphorylase family protein [Nevskiales bacterium]
MDKHASALLRLTRAGIDTYQTPVIFLRADSAVCRSEGFEALSRVRIRRSHKEVIATLNVVSADWIEADEAALSEVAWKLLDAHEGDTAELSHPEPLDSLSFLRAKVYGQTLPDQAIRAIIADVAAGRYSELELAAFVTACAGEQLNQDETVALTRAMVEVGSRVDWGRHPIVDKHCIGGLPGNRTTPIVVAIVAAAGLTIPKTSSRAITSPAGTADTMETLAPVELSLARMRKVVERENGCIVWGGAVQLSPADDVLIRVERPLDFDSAGQLVASVMSKKVAAGSTHVVIDLPVGPTAKVRTREAAQRLADRMVAVGQVLGLEVRPLLTDGSQPVGNGIGPALEARDVLAVLQNQPAAPDDLRERSLELAGAIIELGTGADPGSGLARAAEILDSGRAWAKFQAIAEAQGGLREPPVSRFHRPCVAPQSGIVSNIDSRKLSRLAKFAGAPRDPAAGVDLHVHLGERLVAGQPMFTLHADSAGEIAFALDYLEDHPEIVCLKNG